MRINYNPVATGNLIQKVAEAMESEERAEGTHVSALLFCLRKEWARRHNMMAPPTPDTTLVFMTGRALQDYIVGTVNTEVPLVLDGIHGTLDFLDAGVGVPLEMKATYYSSNDPVEEKAPHYVAQLASYCKMAKVLMGTLCVFYINGPYNLFRKEANKVRGADGKPVRSTLMVYDVEFSQDELDMWWGEMLYRKEVLDQAGDNFSAVPLDLHHTWECDSCSLLGVVCPGGEGRYNEIYQEVFNL